MKKLIIFIVLACLLVPVKAQLWGNALKNDTIFTADIVGADTFMVRKLRAPEGAYIWYEFPTFSGSTNSWVVAGSSADGVKFQAHPNLPSSGVITLDSTHVSYNISGDSIQGQGIDIDNHVGLYWITLLFKGTSSEDTLIIHYNK